jgi:hypothetical protein
LTAPLVVAVVSGLSDSPKKKMRRKHARKWMEPALMAAKSVLFLRGTRDPWMSDPLQVPLVDLHLGAAAAPLAAIDVALVSMKQGYR